MAGVAFVREDGKGKISTIEGSSSGAPPWRISGGMGFDPRNSDYDFCKGHVIDMLFVIGDPRMMDYGPFENLNMSFVVFSYRITAQYEVE